MWFDMRAFLLHVLNWLTPESRMMWEDSDPLANIYFFYFICEVQCTMCKEMYIISKMCKMYVAYWQYLKHNIFF